LEFEKIGLLEDLWLNGCTCHVHLAEVEVDAETGHVEITRYVVAQDVAMKHRLAAYGGHGYDHVIRNIVPILVARGVSDAERPSETGVLIVVGGPQYRVGSHRQFVLTARRLAADGYTTLRFDATGMGDALGEPRSFEQLDDDLGSAIDALLASTPALRRVVLLGLCDGADRWQSGRGCLDRARGA